MSKPRRRSPLPTSSSAKNNGLAASPPTTPPQIPVLQPAIDDRDGWRVYWQAQGQPWRTEPEIDLVRQSELNLCRSIVPAVEKGNYPFKGVKLSRADVEWLLATHESGQGPIDWHEGSPQGLVEHVGLDLRGANLQFADLRRLPLTKIQGGLSGEDWLNANQEQRDLAAIHMEGVNLRWAHLERSSLSYAHLEGCVLEEAHLEGADLYGAHLGGMLFSPQTSGSTAYPTPGGPRLLPTADIRQAFFDTETRLRHISMCDEKQVGLRLADTHWESVSLVSLEWSEVNMLRDEYEARRTKTPDGSLKSEMERLRGYRAAIRANRQLGTVLQSQGLNEVAARFMYRAQVLQRHILRCQMLRHDAKQRRRIRTLGTWLFSWFLYLIAGYGYKPSRSFLAYLLVISGFATAYYVLGHTAGPLLSPLGAFVFSMTSFHGRGFFPGNNISLDDPLTVLAAFEALVGLIIEVTFIATLTQRFFNR